ncbi:MAG: helix-turn-helix transcriptional regulator [Deltaproteobacteria bacterium]|nr:helix-turn-helix transcriptional regulator [Deltaproteobacteria bacterium]
MARLDAEVPFGERLKTWRHTRRLSQLQLALVARVSPRHLSFIETGRAQPSREMVHLLAEHLRLPLRERNALLLAAGFAPAFERRDLGAPEMSAVRAAVSMILKNHEPFPAIAVDRRWNVVMSNSAVPLIAEGVAPELLAPPVNVYRLSLHRDGLRRRVLNFDEYARHLLGRIRHDVEVSGDVELLDLLGEVEAYPGLGAFAEVAPQRGNVVLPIRLRHETGELAFFTTITTFGTPCDVTVEELAIESFFPADHSTAERVRALGASCKF